MGNQGQARAAELIDQRGDIVGESIVIIVAGGLI